jgi:hypothetical protein
MSLSDGWGYPHRLFIPVYWNDGLRGKVFR